MKLTASLTEEQFAELPEDIAENYSQSEDGYVLMVEGMTHEDVSGLKTALQKHKDLVAELKGDKTELQKRLEEINGVEKELETLRTSANESAEKWKKKYAATALNAEIGEAAAATVANPKLLAPLLKEKVKHEFQQDGSLRFVVKDENGAPLLNKETGNPLTVTEFVHSMKNSDDYKGVFRGTGNSGGNSFEAEGGSNNFRVAPRKNRGTMTDKEKGLYVKEHGWDAYQKLPL